jgi:putative protease
MAKAKKPKSKVVKSRKKMKKAAGKKPAAKKKAVKKPVAAAKKPSMPGMDRIGEVTHYFPHVKAAAMKVLKDAIRVGDEIYIKGHTTDFKEKVNSIQLEHVTIQEGKKGQEIGLLVKSRVRIGDSVYRLK